MIMIELNDHTAEDVECILKLQAMGFSNEYIQELYDRTLKKEKDNDST